MANIAVTITVPERLLEAAEGLVNDGHFLSKSDFFREAARLLVEKYTGGPQR
jgi:Arc/MetJ-type ribon-helix-helix transcriptional regulator